MKYSRYCPECYKQGVELKLKHENSKSFCVQCSWESKQ